MIATSHAAHRTSSPRKAAASRGRSTVTFTALTLVAALGLTACGPSVAEPTEAAEQFAEQLSSPEFEGLQDASLAQESIDPEALTESISELENYPVAVTLDSAAVNEDEADDTAQESEDEVTASANYTVTWDLSGGADNESSDDASETSSSDWTYTAEATLIWNDEAEAWEPQLTSDTLVPGLAEGGHIEVETESAERGNILDTHDDPLTAERPVQRIGIDKTHLLNQLSADNEPTEDEITDALTESATELAEALELDVDTFVDRTLAAGERAWVEFIVLRDDDETEIPFNEIGEIPGAIAHEDTMVLGPTSTFARGVLGSFGEPTAEQVENSDGDMVAGVPTGLSGLQRNYNAELAGLDGLTITVDNSETTSEQRVETTPVEFSREATDGSAITTTLDTRVQELAEDILDESEVPGGLVVLRPSDGHILAAVDGPAETSWPLALTGSYAPGSTFKVVTALAMLRNGMTPDSTVDCPPSLEIGGTEIANFEGYPSEYLGEITLAEATAQSCNTTFVGQSDEITPQQEHEAAEALGLVSDPAVGFDGAFLGSVPTDVEGSQHAAGLFGQGVVEASPLGMATVAASVAAGETVNPVLLTDPAIDPEENENLPVESPLTEDEATMLAELMAGPVENGTVPVLQDVPGAPVLAKTGTAQFVEDEETLAHTWIMATHGDLAVSLFFTEGFAGAQTNGPVLQEFLTQLEEIIPSE